MNNISKITALAIPFTVIVSAFYLLGYWGLFSVDVFSYLTASDFLVQSVVPMLGIGIFFMLGVCISTVTIRFNKVTEGSDNQKVILAKKGVKVFDKIIIVIFVLGLIFGGPSRWLILPILFAVLISLLLTFSGFLKEIVPR